VLEGEGDPVDLYRTQGKADMLKIVERLPEEVKGLLEAFRLQDERDKELEREKELRNVKLR
jgi:hypothetical protein